MHVSMHCAEAQREVHSVEYEVEAVLDARGPPEHRYYKIRWAGWGSDGDSWEPWRRHVAAWILRRRLDPADRVVC